MWEGHMMKRKSRRSGKSEVKRDDRKSHSQEIWSRAVGESGFPARLLAHPSAADWQMVYGLGNAEILKQPCVGLMCSIKCPGSVVIRTFDAARELRDTGVVVTGGFHSPMEKECLEFLLRGQQPVILCPARHPPASRFSSEWKQAIDAGRLLLLSPFDEKVRRATTNNAQRRNEFVAALASAVLVPHASSGGKVESTALGCLKRRQPVFTLDDEENDALISNGALSYSVENVQRRLRRRQASKRRGD